MGYVTAPPQDNAHELQHTCNVYVYLRAQIQFCSIPFCPRVFSDEEIVAEAISDGLLSASIYPNSSPARTCANFEYDIYLSVMTCRRMSFASNCNVPSSKSCITSGSKLCVCVCVCVSVCRVCVGSCLATKVFIGKLPAT